MPTTHTNPQQRPFPSKVQAGHHSCINIHMNNKTNNMFRFKVKKPRQTCMQLDRRVASPQEEESFSKNKGGFSSEYISLARKFNIKIVTDHSQGKIRGGSQVQSIDFKQERIKTEFAKTKSRYFMMDTPTNKLDLRHHSFWLNEKQGDLSSRREKQALVKLNKNTVYNDMFFRLKTEEEKDPQGQEPLKLNLSKGNDILTNLGRHCQKLFAIKQAIEKQGNPNEAIRQIKVYILRQEGASISKLDGYFLEEPLKKQIKELVIMERMALLSIVVNILSHHFEQLAEVSSRTVEVILGFWYQVLNHTYSSNIFQLQIQQNSPIKQILQTLSEAKLLTKSNIKLLLDTVGQKLAILYKHFKPFYKQISFLTQCCHSLSINRAFYELLTLFAGFITHYQNQHRVMLDSVSFFATCPSPYLVKVATKPYTLVVDLDQTLIYFASSSGKEKGKERSDVQYRPGSIEFISELSKYYEIVVFTTAVQSYARQTTRQFKGIDHFLFRQHAVRVKSGFIKDLSRLGRDLNKVIIVDDTTNNFKLQKDNAIRVSSWKGDPNDNQLQEVKELLLRLVEAKPAKITTFLMEHKKEAVKKQPSKKVSTVLSQEEKPQAKIEPKVDAKVEAKVEPKAEQKVPQ